MKLRAYFVYYYRPTSDISIKISVNECFTCLQSTLALNTTGKVADKWEIPRHHIKVFNILGEGCFGQVWKCEALNIDS